MFRITLEEFEGPLDLLLFFIRRDELDIYNIPISRITADFIVYINGMRATNLEVAAEFIYMASMLMSIKAKMLLPRPSAEIGDTDEFDPRTELVQKLLEYRQMKECAGKLGELADERARLFSKGFAESFDPLVVDQLDEEIHRPTLYHLITAYRSVLENIPKPMIRNVKDAPVTVEEQSALILSKLRERVQVSFRSVMEGVCESIIFVVTFLAVLELCRNGKIVVVVKEGHDDFWMAVRDGA
ncbi:MAG: segregation/condensation protein A [Chlorobium limicola]|uniref:Segregation and condensation protein A n=1 Tax=Chlorobium limicola (strain DSM 245 / NBRC 103803 / 6330) TaxID=290315 RepID=B3EE69_CHLL2|nr:segregation/condensation protein A [Chlorobium limicola]ACD89203.1 chromosome segregation and condensation protein ScpA [Chlorobium limicola DSM 245]NTV21674.1 segregation/condensation protein A [Chlorobium limicola]